MSSFVKVRPVVAELLHADRHDEANSCFSQFFRTRPGTRGVMRYKWHLNPCHRL